MGTSQSKPPARPGKPLIPAWADQDPPPTDQPPAPEPDGQDELAPRRNSGVRRALGQYLKTGDERHARRALRHHSRGSMGGGAAAGQRFARAARVGGTVLSALASAAAGQPAQDGVFDLGTLAGQPVSEAIVAIVDAFCPPGIIDEDAIRAAMSEALAEALSGLDKFDPNDLDNHAVLVATRCFVAELVFNTITVEQGQAAAGVTPQLAVERENRLRGIIRELTDVVATPILQQAGAAMTPSGIEGLVKAIVTSVYEALADD